MALDHCKDEPIADTDTQTADRLVRRRARLLPVLAFLFIAQQGTYFATADDQGRAVDHLKVSAWLVLSIALLIAFATGGGWFRNAHVRALLNDESTRANRAEGFRIGFLATMIGAVALYFLSYFEPIDGREAIHSMMTIGLAAALVRFGMLERRALKDG